jgi:aldose 1-epimerase
MTTLDLVSPELRVSIAPALGGGVARLDWLGSGEPLPLFRPWDGVTHQARSTGCMPLIPWSNRISGGGIEAGGKFWPLAANRMPDDPLPIHGDGFQSIWSVHEHSDSRIVLELVSRKQPPFDYRALLAYELAGSSFTMRLSVEHRGDVPTPYGLGFHPWFPRAAGTTLEAPAAEVWLEHPNHLPDRKIPVRERPDWDFSLSRNLPLGKINNAFDGWLGKARIRWPERSLSLSLTASPELATCIIFSPGPGSGFFCLEPVTHPVDAFHLPGMPGLRVLQRGEGFEVSCRYTAAIEVGG